MCIQVMGVKGPTWLSCLKSLDLVRGMSHDYMHCGLLGLSKMLLGLWTDTAWCRGQYTISISPWQSHLPHYGVIRGQPQTSRNHWPKALERYMESVQNLLNLSCLQPQSTGLGLFTMLCQCWKGTCMQTTGSIIFSSQSRCGCFSSLRQAWRILAGLKTCCRCSALSLGLCMVCAWNMLALAKISPLGAFHVSFWGHQWIACGPIIFHGSRDPQNQHCMLLIHL